MDQQFPLAAVQITALDLEVDPLDIVDPIQFPLRVVDRHRHGFVQILLDHDRPIAPIEIGTLDTGIRGVAVYPVYAAKEEVCDYCRFSTIFFLLYSISDDVNHIKFILY